MTAVPAFFLKVSNFQLTLTLARAAARLGQRGGRVARPALPSPDPRCYASFHTVSPYTFKVVPIVARQAEVHQRRRLGQTHLPASVTFLVK